MEKNYDLIVVGAGHAGCEAAHIAATMGCKVLLVTMNMETIAKMSCNPAMGGVAKGQIIREIDALGGMSAHITDRSMIQFRMLNRSKGAAMWSPRRQNDRWLFARYWRITLEQNPNIHFFQDMVKGIHTENGKITGVKTAMGSSFYAQSVILTNGTFLNGLIHIGDKQYGGGRMGEVGSTGITEQLVSHGFETGRMKTGTPPRVDGRSIDYSKMEEQKGDDEIQAFTFLPHKQTPSKQKSCFITYTNPEVHDKLREGFHLSPMFNGAIEGLGPRYCPSIEDKINRFSERDRHQIFVEPEGWDTVEIYVNGFSTSLPDHIQYEAIKKIPGFEAARIFRPGYAIEYDYFQPTQLKPTLETQGIDNLYFAGQINGTTGYEEAAGQGLMAGINAAAKIQDKEPLVLKRNEAYIGVLIDDLVNKGTDEPYRMFTSRAEYRISLRQDNADVRLTPIAQKYGTASKERIDALHKKTSFTKDIIEYITKTNIEPSNINPILEKTDRQTIKQKVKLKSLLARPDVNIRDLSQAQPDTFLKDIEREYLEHAEINVKYEPYIKRELEQVDKLTRLEHLTIAEEFDYGSIKALSSEAKNKLSKIKPTTIGQASRISGVSPADISVLLVYFGR